LADTTRRGKFSACENEAVEQIVTTPISPWIIHVVRNRIAKTLTDY
jgi:hypothetical protein